MLVIEKLFFYILLGGGSIFLLKRLLEVYLGQQKSQKNEKSFDRFFNRLIEGEKYKLNKYPPNTNLKNQDQESTNQTINTGFQDEKILALLEDLTWDHSLSWEKDCLIEAKKSQIQIAPNLATKALKDLHNEFLPLLSRSLSYEQLQQITLYYIPFYQSIRLGNKFRSNFSKSPITHTGIQLHYNLKVLQQLSTQKIQDRNPQNSDIRHYVREFIINESSPFPVWTEFSKLALQITPSKFPPLDQLEEIRRFFQLPFSYNKKDIQIKFKELALVKHPDKINRDHLEPEQIKEVEELLSREFQQLNELKETLLKNLSQN